MNQQNAVNVAMDAERSAKQAVRDIWLEQIRGFHSRFPDDEVPLLLTLSGAKGRDIRQCIDAGIFELNETGGLSQKSIPKVVAVERNAQAVLELQRQFSGLQIVEQDFKSIIAGDSPLNFPRMGEKHNLFCCARVVNLDLNTQLLERRDSVVNFPILNWSTNWQ